MRTRFTIEVDGVRKNLFTVLEKANGDNRSRTDLNIHFNDGGYILPGDSVDQLVGPIPVSEYRPSHIHFSVHASVRSDIVNQIHREVRLLNGPRLDSHYVTTALKKDDLFAPVMMAICGDFKSELSNVREKDDCEEINLTALDTLTGTLRFMIVIGNAGKTFQNPTAPFQHHPSQLFQRQYRDYQLIVIFSFFNWGAQQQTIDLVPSTQKETGVARGLDWWEIYNMYNEFSDAYALAYLKPKHPS